MIFVFPLFYATFLCGHYNIFKKLLNLFFARENIKKRGSKVAHNLPQIFFSQYSPAAQTSPELIFDITNMSQDSSVSLSVVVSLPLRFRQLFLYKGELWAARAIRQVGLGPGPFTLTI